MNYSPPRFRTAAVPLLPTLRLDAVSNATIVLVIGFWLGAFSWLRPLTLPDEGRYAGVAWDMLRSHSPLTPLLNGMPYFHKPPLYYWLCDISFMIFGVNPWAARLPSLLAALLIVTMMLRFLTAFFDRKIAVATVLVLATMPFFYGGAQFANLDMLVAGLIGATVLQGATVMLAPAPSQRAIVTVALLAAAGVLAKGLIGVALPGAILVAWALATRRPRALLMLLAPAPIAAFLIAALPWFLIMQWKYPDFFQYFFIVQQLDRFASVGYNNAQPMFFYVPVILAMTLPWTLWLAKAKSVSLKALFWSDDAAKLMSLWFAVILVFFSIPHSKLIGYVLPLLPPLAFFLCRLVLMHAPTVAQRHVFTRAFSITIGIAALLCLIVVGIAAARDGGSGREAAQLLKRRVQSSDIVLTLGSLPFDLPLYAQLKKPMWILDDWTSPDIAKRDNWRKELFDAAKFAPPPAGEVLVTPEQLRARMCAPENEHRRIWVWGREQDAQGDLAFAPNVPHFTRGRYTVWLANAQDMPAPYRCATPG
ncbi:glycosyltransferase family 39 protein [Alcaligenaceae bacterium C4P045]|nr:glycosyltransferase family 39 protein [Alcaligenaceae bacterium C4P045]